MKRTVPERSILNSYLSQKGWGKGEGPAGVIVFTEPGRHDNPFRLRVPPSQALDYERTIELALETIGAVEGRHSDDVGDELINWAMESFSLRILTDYNPSLDDAAIAIPKLRQLMVYGIAAEIRFESLVRKVPNEATSFVRDFCEFGHTRHESFGITVEIPVNLQGELVEGAPSPMGRRMFARLIQGLQDPQRLFSANIAKLFLDLTQTISSEHEYKANFSEVNGPYEGPTSGRVTREIGRNLAEYYESVLQQQMGADLAMVQGRVVSVKWNDDFRTDGEAVVHWKRTDQHPLNVKMQLSKADTIRAFDASRDGLDVRFRGLLTHQPNRQHTLESAGILSVAGEIESE